MNYHKAILVCPNYPKSVLARQMKAELVGKTIVDTEVLQPKSLNLPPEVFVEAVTSSRLLDVSHHGKWILVETTQGWLLFNLGMGGEILLTTRDNLPEKHRLIFDYDDGAALAINFWWFGYVHYSDDPANHPMVGKLGPDMLSLNQDEFRELLQGRRGGIKPFLLNQSRIAGIGNVYAQDPLFKAGIHPLRPIPTLSEAEETALWQALTETLRESIKHGGSAWELNLYGEKGGWDDSYLLVGYREGRPCPVCGTTIEKIKTGSTSSFICPRCQSLDQ